MRVALLALWVVGCQGDEPGRRDRRRDAPEVTGATGETAAPGDTGPPWTNPFGPRSVWGDLGPCTRPEVAPPRPVPKLVPVCQPRPPRWTSGPVAGWARAVIRSPGYGSEFVADRLGSALATVAGTGHGPEGLAVGAPTTSLPGSYYFSGTPDVPPEATASSGSVYLFAVPTGELWTGRDGLLMAQESGSSSNSVGYSIAAIPGATEVLVGDYWVAADPEPSGHVKVVDPDTSAFTAVYGDPVDLCGADVAAADVDGSGVFDVVTACLGDLWENPGAVGVFGGSGTSWDPIGRVEGTMPYAWFGRPTVGGFDLDRDGVDELAIGEQHAGKDLDSLVHLISGAWTGHCHLDELGAVALHNEFSPARLAVGDVDHDAVNELLVTNRGYPSWSLTDDLLGWVHVLRDPVEQDTATSAAAWLTFEGSDPGEAFGADVAVGDFNGDRCPDVAVGAPGFDLNATNPPGKVYVFHGPFEPGVVSATAADVVLEGYADWDFFGLRLVTGDYDGDGIDDLAVAAPLDSTVGTEAGAVYVLAAP